MYQMYQMCLYHFFGEYNFTLYLFLTTALDSATEKESAQRIETFFPSNFTYTRLRAHHHIHARLHTSYNGWPNQLSLDIDQ
jgi:hypothetical protein